MNVPKANFTGAFGTLVWRGKAVGGGKAARTETGRGVERGGSFVKKMRDSLLYKSTLPCYTVEH